MREFNEGSASWMGIASWLKRSQMAREHVGFLTLGGKHLADGHVAFLTLSDKHPAHEHGEIPSDPGEKPDDSAASEVLDEMFKEIILHIFEAAAHAHGLSLALKFLEALVDLLQEAAVKEDRCVKNGRGIDATGEGFGHHLCVNPDG